ncbi:MAG TPA: bi-domain-containing oxidoreductase [Candidatus Aquicultor sp.]
MKQVLIKQGQAIVEEIPAPQVEPGTVLVQVDHSCISVGTEMSGVKVSAMPLWKRALKQPQNVKKAFQMVATQGLAHTRSVVEGKLSAGSPTGYSATGIVLEVGEGIDDIQPGDRVACAGAQCAHHAEIIRVPRNLTVLVPDELGFPAASTVTLGAIAMQGVRRATPTLGETFVVLGLGILGQLTIQLLKANGCRVIGTDLDRTRIEQARGLGMDVGIIPQEEDDIEAVARLTDGYGADGVIITAATPSDAVVSTAFKMCRKKGRVVLVGDVGLSLNREDFYQKELDFFISSSYGPGRYDNNYEEKGLDYPVAFVRWTENRNMTEYLRLLAEGKVSVDPMIAAIYPVDKAGEAYAALKSDTDRPLMVLLSYPRPVDERLTRTVVNPHAQPSGKTQVKLALVGAGGFAKGMHLPNMKELSDLVQLHAVMSRTGQNAIATATQFGAKYATTDYSEVLRDPEVDAILIATRHNLHTPMVFQALKAGKHVLVEKPLALNEGELKEIEAFYSAASGPSPILLTGFNRRFSKYGQRIYELTKNRSNPMILNYRMNAGYIPLNHWVHTEEGGGRNIGEACHIYDLFTFLVGSKVVAVDAKAVSPATGYYGKNDNFVATISFEDGSVATLTYTALGSKDHPKEQLEVFVDGKVITLDDYKKLTVTGANVTGVETKLSDKGQREELEAFCKAVKAGGEWPISLWQQVQAMQIAFAVEESFR